MPMTFDNYITSNSLDPYHVAFRLLWFKVVCRTQDDLILFEFEQWGQYELTPNEVTYLDNYLGINQKEH